MKMTIFLLAAAALCGTASATILRVNNVATVGAPYTSLSDAITAATEGDTIMVDGSSTSYGDITVNKRLVIMGPGYLRSENGVLAEGSSSAMTGTITFDTGSTGSIIQGMDATGTIDVTVANITITRCRVRLDLMLRDAAANAVIHQNYFSGPGSINWFSYGGDKTSPHGTQITNNIFNTRGAHDGSIRPAIRFIIDGYIAYNTFTYPGSDNFSDLTNCTLEHNIFVGNETTITGCTFIDNYWTGMKNSSGVAIYSKRDTDKTMKDEVLSEELQAAIAGKGAFNGDDPYVISGLPAGPVIEDITVPASVEKGQPLNITIKLGIQK